MAERSQWHNLKAQTVMQNVIFFWPLSLQCEAPPWGGGGALDVPIKSLYNYNLNFFKHGGASRRKHRVFHTAV